MPGSLRSNTLNESVALHPKKRVSLKAGDRLKVCMPGGGGVGNPRERSREALADDILNGYVTEAQAVALYGYRPAKSMVPLEGSTDAR